MEGRVGVWVLDLGLDFMVRKTRALILSWMATRCTAWEIVRVYELDEQDVG